MGVVEDMRLLLSNITIKSSCAHFRSRTAKVKWNPGNCLRCGLPICAAYMASELLAQTVRKIEHIEQRQILRQPVAEIPGDIMP